MNGNPLVSVLIITYNQVNFIKQTLESAIHQSYNNYEIVVADDHSTDGTAEVISSYADLFPNKIIPALGQKNLGITGNSNRALKLCRGKYIALLGGDDIFYPTKIEKQVRWLEANDKRVICGHLLKLCDNDSRVYGNHKIIKISGKGPNKWIELGTLYGASSIMLRSKNLPPTGFDERMPYVSDWKLYIDLLEEDSEYGFIPEFLGAYRRHANNITNIKAPLMKDMMKTFEIVSLDSRFKKLSIRKGLSYLYWYGQGNDAIASGQYSTSFHFLLKSLVIWPFNFKAYVKLLQATYYSLVKFCYYR